MSNCYYCSIQSGDPLWDGSSCPHVVTESNEFRPNNFSRIIESVVENLSDSDKKLIMDGNKESLNLQVGGTHYKDMKIQPVEFIHGNGLSFFQGNIIKYICRYKNKGGKKDLEKIIHYAQILIDLEYSDMGE